MHSGEDEPDRFDEEGQAWRERERRRSFFRSINDRPVERVQWAKTCPTDPLRSRRMEMELEQMCRRAFLRRADRPERWAIPSSAAIARCQDNRWKSSSKYRAANSNGREERHPRRLRHSAMCELDERHAGQMSVPKRDDQQRIDRNMSEEITMNNRARPI